MSLQLQCSRRVNRGQRGAVALVMLLSCMLAQAAATVGRTPASVFADRADLRAGLAGGHGRSPRALAPDVLVAHPVGVLVNATRQPPVDGPRPFTFAPRAVTMQDAWRGDERTIARAAAPLALRWQDRPEWERNLRGFRRGGAPLVHLWQSAHAVVGIGVSRRGIAGIYLTQSLSR